MSTWVFISVEDFIHGVLKYTLNSIVRHYVTLNIFCVTLPSLSYVLHKWSLCDKITHTQIKDWDHIQSCVCWPIILFTMVHIRHFLIFDEATLNLPLVTFICSCYHNLTKVSWFYVERKPLVVIKSNYGQKEKNH